MAKKSQSDLHTCTSCESYKPVNPSDDAGYCHLSPPIWIKQDGIGDWTRPVVGPSDSCRQWQRKLNS